LGMSLIDTAEMYGEGAAETLVGEAIAGKRAQVFLVSKVYPHRANRSDIVAACEGSLRRLRTDYLDLYLLHWRGAVPFRETLAGFERLKRHGKIREYGVSNLDLDEMEEWFKLPGGGEVFTNQVLYNLTRRGIEWDLLPWCRVHKIPVMAYSPVEQGRLPEKMESIARKVRASRFQLALAWLLQQDGVIAIPKAGSEEHVRENRKALDMSLSKETLDELDNLFPPPRKKVRLAML
jgi:diketogulonate reductase-like aldo/keto reductase